MSMDKALAEVRACARRLGLDDLPTGRPAYTDLRTLFKLQVVRALYNHPRLLIVERPMMELEDAFRTRVREFIDGLRATEGTAVLFIANWTDTLHQEARQASLSSGCWTLHPDISKTAPETLP
jgi:ABC-type branched-subunit amino acid transport system ATPase component